MSHELLATSIRSLVLGDAAAGRVQPSIKVVPEEGFEPSLSCPRRILSPLRLPFRHSGVPLILALNDSRVNPREST